MLSYKDIIKLKALYQNNENIIQYIKSNTQLDTEAAILHSYDLQAGSYIRALSDDKHQCQKEQIGQKLAKILKELSINSVCEAGVGEATTLKHVLSAISFKKTYGFDISVSPILFGQEYLKRNNLEVSLFCAELSSIPFSENAIDCIYTYHSVANNGGKEKLLLTELLRVANNYLILIEPDYQMFGNDQRERMDYHGYTRNLDQHLIELGAKIIHHEAWGLDSNPLNKASIIIVEKNPTVKPVCEDASFVSPISQKVLNKVQDGFFCKDDGYFFPAINKIPILMKKNAILVTHYSKFIDTTFE